MANKKVILVITSSIDETVTYLERKYEEIVDFYRVNIDELALYAISITNTGVEISKGTHKIAFPKDVESILYRKPMVPDIRQFERAYHSMIQNDIIAMIEGIVNSFEGRVLTKPCILRKCENKIYQLMYAARNDIIMPHSFIGNSNDQLNSLSNRKSIIKPLTTGKVYHKNYCELFQTSFFDEYQEDVSLTPVYVQDYIAKKYEVRLTVVDNNYFAVKIIPGDIVDWRKSYETNRYEIIEVPQKIKKQVRDMMQFFNLDFGALDFIVSEDERWYFLEINPNGQWLWLENELDLKISNAIITYLCGGINL